MIFSIFLKVIMACFLLINIAMCAYMEYNAIRIAKRCACIHDDVYWYVIIVYFGVSVLFLLFHLAKLWTTLEVPYTLVMVCYTLFTVVFVASSYRFTQQIESGQCTCGSNEVFMQVLHIVFIMRVLMLMISFIVVFIWCMTYLYKKILP